MRVLSLKRLTPYGVAVLSVALATAVRLTHGHLLDETAPLLIFAFAIVLTAWFGGFWPGLLATVALSTAFASSIMWVFLTLGVIMKSAQSVQAMGFLVLFPLQFGSSIFAPTDSMPGWLQGFTDYNPLSTLADASRGLMVGGPVAHDLWVTLGWSVAITAVMAPVAIHKFRTKS